MINKKIIHWGIYFLTTKFKFFAFIAAFLYIIGLFWFVLKDFRSDDPIPEIKVLKIDMRKQYRDLSAKVKAGMVINNFIEFDFTKNNFVIDALVWFKFKNSELPLDSINEFCFVNGSIKRKSAPNIVKEGDEILAKYNVIFETKTDLNFHRFPLEDHRLGIILSHERYNAYELNFDDDDTGGTSFIISDKVFTSNWKFLSSYKAAGYVSARYNQHELDKKLTSPRVLFLLNFKKAGLNKILIIFIPMFAALFLSLFTFLMSFNSYQGKTMLAVTAVTAILGYRFVIQQMSPPVAYFTLSDKIFIFFLILSFAILIFQILLLRHYMFLMDREKIRKDEQPEPDRTFLVPRITEKINLIGYCSALIIFVIGCTKILI